jgi:hypothetical protein
VLLTKYCLDHQIKEDEMGGVCTRVGEERNAYRVLIGKPEGKRPHGSSRHRWEDNVKMDLKEI